MGAGGFLMWGGLSGRLAPMLAAVFDPTLLTEAKNVGGGFPLLDDINPPKGGEAIAPGTGPGADGHPLIGAPPTEPIGPGTPAIGSGGGSIIDVLGELPIIP
jgi:hypothetical protein